MPPLLRPSIFPGKESWFPPVGLQHIIEGSLLLALFITALRSILVARRRGMMVDSSISQNDSPLNRDKKLAIHQRKDSYQEEVLHHAKAKINGLEATSEKTSSPEPQEDAFIRRPSLDQEPNQYLQSLQQETLQPTLSPIYPWISPPQNLPGQGVTPGREPVDCDQDRSILGRRTRGVGNHLIHPPSPIEQPARAQVPPRRHSHRLKQRLATHSVDRHRRLSLLYHILTA
jgi:hypothetical protein